MFLKSERVISELAPTVRLNTFSSHLRKKICIKKQKNQTKLDEKERIMRVRRNIGRLLNYLECHYYNVSR